MVTTPDGAFQAAVPTQGITAAQRTEDQCVLWGVSKDMKRHGQTGALSTGAAVILGAGQSLTETKLRPSFAGQGVQGVFGMATPEPPTWGSLSFAW